MLALQIYAPLDDDVAHEQAFHRELFMFVTPKVCELLARVLQSTYTCSL
jgi:hypothetical protein